MCRLMVRRLLVRLLSHRAQLRTSLSSKRLSAAPVSASKPCKSKSLQRRIQIKLRKTVVGQKMLSLQVALYASTGRRKKSTCGETLQTRRPNLALLMFKCYLAMLRKRYSVALKIASLPFAIATSKLQSTTSAPCKWLRSTTKANSSWTSSVQSVSSIVP